MSIAFSRLSWWLWAGKEQEPSVPSVSSATSSSSSSEPDSVNFLSVSGARFPSASRKVKRKWHSREERKGIDREYDIVLVPSEGVCMSGSESDDSDWSIGWLEPHAPEFQDDDEMDNSFAVLVRCYGSPSGDSAAGRSENRLVGTLVSGSTTGTLQRAKDAWRSGHPPCRNNRVFTFAADREGGHTHMG